MTQFFDYNNTRRNKRSKEYRAYKKLCIRLNASDRNPSPKEWDQIIKFNYPDWKLKSNEKRGLKTSEEEYQEMVAIPDYEYIKMFKNDEESVKWEKTHPFNFSKQIIYKKVPLNEKKDYV